MYLKVLLMLAGAASTAFSAAVPAPKSFLEHVMRRQTNTSSVCTTSGVNYQEGGTYFIDTDSDQSFMIVSTFQGCQNDTADISFVNESTGDQYDCGSVPTVPNGVPQTATCPVLKSQLTSGTYLIITIGNNGGGAPIAFQRQITITAGTQQTITQNPTTTITTTPTVLVNSTYYVEQTTSVSNCATITAPPVTRITTRTLCNSTAFQNRTTTQTVDLSTTTDAVSTVTVTPTCRVSDRVCTRLLAPTGNATASGGQNVYRRMLVCEGDDGMPPSILKRVPDQTADITFATGSTVTVTVTAAPITKASDVPITIFIPITAAPVTASSGEVVQTVTLPGSTVIQQREVSTTVFATKTITRASSTKTVITVPSGLAAECQQKGGILEI